jgi:hypothetical protein
MPAVDITQPHVRRATIQFDGDTSTLEVLRYDITERLDWSPTVSATVTVGLPTGFPTAILDPRAPTPLTLLLNTYPLDVSLGPDPAQTATFRLIPRDVAFDWIGREATITAHSTDLLSLWYPYSEVQLAANDTLVYAMQSVRNMYAPTPIPITCTAPAGYTLGEVATWRRDATGATFLRSLADRSNCTLLAQRGGGWSMVTTSSINNPTAPALALSQRNVTGLSSRVDATRFGNAVTSEYANEKWSQTDQTTGPWAVGTVGRRTLHVDQSNVPFAEASSVGAILRRALRRGDTWSVDALAWHPLRVGQWVRLTWGTEFDLTQRVDVARFTDTGAMSLTLSDPTSDTSTIARAA